MKFLKILFLLLITKTYSQSFKEVVEFHDNGKTKVEHVKNIDLKLIKVNVYDTDGTLIEFVNYDPDTEKKNGPFMEGANEGFYNQDKLNCEFCSIVVSKYNGGQIYTQFEGEFKNGYPVGQIDVYRVFQVRNSNYDQTLRYLKSLNHLKQINYSSFLGINLWSKSYLYTLNFKSGGLLDGNIKLSKNYELEFNSGILNKIFSKNSKNPSIYRDSIGRDFKIWKINNKYYKNNGFLGGFNWVDYEGMDGFEVTSIQDSEFSYFFGNEKTELGKEFSPLVIFDGYNYSYALNESGVFERKINGKQHGNDSRFTDSNDEFRLEDLIFAIPLDLENFDVLIGDTPILELIENIVMDSEKYSDNQLLSKEFLSDLDQNVVSIIENFYESLIQKDELDPIKYYRFIQSILNLPNPPFLDVYVTDPELVLRDLSYYSDSYIKYKDLKNRRNPLFDNNNKSLNSRRFLEKFEDYHERKLKTIMIQNRKNDSISKLNEYNSKDEIKITNISKININDLYLVNTSDKSNKSKYYSGMKDFVEDNSEYGIYKYETVSPENSKNPKLRFSKLYFRSLDDMNNFKNKSFISDNTDVEILYINLETYILVYKINW